MIYFIDPQNVDSTFESISDFVAHSPTAFHASEHCCKILTESGAQVLHEADPFPKLEPEKMYVIVRDGAIIAFTVPRKVDSNLALRISVSHTDSPAFRVKSLDAKYVGGFAQMPVEVYGSPIISSFLDRDLALGFRFILQDGSVHLGQISNFARISNLAIHLSDSRRSHQSAPDLQTSTTPFIALLPCKDDQNRKNSISDGFDLRQTLLSCVVEKYATENKDAYNVLKNASSADIIAADCFLTDSQRPARVGAFGEMLASSRLDNLSSVWASVYAFVQSSLQVDTSSMRIFAAFDHEEIGSRTLTGARGTFLQSALQRVFANLGLNQEEAFAALARSFCASCDAAHAFNPNYLSKYDPQNHPLMGSGPCLKIHADQHYATDALSQWAICTAAKSSGAALQQFLSNNSVPCGSTIGPMVASQMGVRTFDCGVPILSMHSARELASLSDLEDFYRLLCAFYVG